MKCGPTSTSKPNENSPNWKVCRTSVLTTRVLQETRVPPPVLLSSVPPLNGVIAVLIIRPHHLTTCGASAKRRPFRDLLFSPDRQQCCSFVVIVFGLCVKSFIVNVLCSFGYLSSHQTKSKCADTRVFVGIGAFR